MSVSRCCRVLAWAFMSVFCCAAGIAEQSQWEYDGMIDLAYANAFQSDENISWRGKATSQRLNRFAANMGMFYLRKPAAEQSRWGAELGAQAGYDTDGQVPAEQRLPGYSILRYVSRANVSYLAPVGNGLNLTAGLMNSFIGFESMFAKDNPNYTRSWMADYSPYYLMGMAAQYPLNDSVSLGLYVVGDYDYLAYRNDQPKYGAQFKWAIDPQWQLTQNVFAGPEQRNTDQRFWRYFSDTQLRWANADLMLALAYDVGTEKLDDAGLRQTLWMGSALFSRWHIGGPWSLAVRPEIYWDGDGRMTGSRQFIKAVTTTLEYKISLPLGGIAFRTEYRFDDSSGPQGGFFRNQQADNLVAGQHLLLFSCLLTLEPPKPD